MSVLHRSEHGWIISHEKYIKNIYENVQINNKPKNIQLKQLLFNIKSPYLRYNQNTQDNLKRKRKKITSKSNFEELTSKVKLIEKQFKLLASEAEFKTCFTAPLSSTDFDNKEAQTEADKCYNEIDKISFINFHGQNTDQPIQNTVNEANYFFPKSCRFFCKNINEMDECLKDKEQFDVVLLDPPWWNKYIRRKNAHGNQGYQMMYNLDLSVIPVDAILSADGLVIVWCTNSPQHLKDLLEEIFPKWGVRFVAKWFWLKVTTSGVPICGFSEPPGKQPFEQIIFGVRENNKNDNIPRDRLVVSVPSALHSHKPPLADLLKEFVGDEARCLEIFARYLLPGWTSWGLEVLKLQHECLYEET